MALANLFLLEPYPEVSPYLGYLMDLQQIQVTGTIPEKSLYPVKISLDFETIQSKKFNVDLQWDPQTSPPKLEISVGSLNLPIKQIYSVLPSGLLPSDVSGEVRILKAHFKGPLGEWSSWEHESRLEIKLADLNLPNLKLWFGNPKVILEGKGRGMQFGGGLSFTSDELRIPGIETPLSLIQARDLTINSSLKDMQYQISGPWQTGNSPVGPLEGTLTLSSNSRNRINLQSKYIDWFKTGLQIDGDWRGDLIIEYDPGVSSSLSYECNLTGQGFRYGSLNLSARPLMIRSLGSLSRQGISDIKTLLLNWSDAFRLEMNSCRWDGTRFTSDQTSLTGDLLVLGEFFSGVTPNPRYGQWISPRDWNISGGLDLQIFPSLALTLKNANLDSGKGIRGPIEFTYNSSQEIWSFSSPTLPFEIRQFIQVMGLGDRQLSGNLLCQVNLKGLFSEKRTPRFQVQSANVKGDIRDCSGRINTAKGSPFGEEPMIDWRGVNGSFFLDWQPDSVAVKSSLRGRDLVWHTRSARSKRDYPKQLVTAGFRVELQAGRQGNGDYELPRLDLFLGEDTPIQLSAQGRFVRKRNKWLPDLQLRGRGTGVKETPLFRGIIVAGNGEFVGTLKDKPEGDWILDGDLKADGVYFEQVAVPFSFRNVRGNFFIREIHLDEILFHDRWQARDHHLPAAPQRLEELKQAFTDSNTSPNLRIDEAQFGDQKYLNLTLRTFLKAHILFVNTLEGKFHPGGYPFLLHGYVFFHPSFGPGWRMVGATSRVPLSFALPIVESKVGLPPVDVTFVLSANPMEERIETRALTMGFPIGKLREIPGLGDLFFGWTPDSLGNQTLLVQRVGDGNWQILNSFSLPNAMEVPRLPGRIIGNVRDKATGFIEGFTGGVRDMLRGP